jgi:hypothetical protein
MQVLRPTPQQTTGTSAFGALLHVCADPVMACSDLDDGEVGYCVVVVVLREDGQVIGDGRSPRSRCL